MVRDILPYFQCRLLAATADWLASAGQLPDCETVEISADEMHSASLMRTPQHVLALFEQPQYDFKLETLCGKLVLALDGIQDPGNMGTILRVCDWFGVHTVFCDPECASVHNPKAVQASMGAVFRVEARYVELPALIAERAGGGFPCYGTFLDGESIYEADLSPRGLIVMGNEGKGISPEIERLVGRRLTIPSFAGKERRTESLNVGVATGIVLSEFRRSQFV